MNTILEHVERLMGYGLFHGLISWQDTPYCRNQLLDILALPQPMPGFDLLKGLPCQDATATALLDAICQYAAERGLFDDSTEQRDLFCGKLMGVLTARPSDITRQFYALYQRSPKEATDWFYALCKANDYIKVERIANNIVYEEPSQYGDLVITINVSKPEKDPRDIERQLQMQSVNYPSCMLCIDNPGYAGRPGFPARQNHRTIPLTLHGEPWHIQYSPYLYYEEHCIALCQTHRPMDVNRDTFERLFDFVDQFPHYFMGSNAGLPIVGGSILNHDHFQGGSYILPMMKAPIRMAVSAPEGIEAGIVEWPMSCLRLRGKDRAALVALGAHLFDTWLNYSDEGLGIFSHTDSRHNAVTPVVRRDGADYIFDIVFRNNRTSSEFPMGIFHPHPDLHHVKMENIGLIEVMGLFVLPGRLKDEFAEIQGLLTGETDTKDAREDVVKHLEWVEQLKAENPHITAQNAGEVLRRGLVKKCERILFDAGVFKPTPEGNAGFLRFLHAAGLNP